MGEPSLLAFAVAAALWLMLGVVPGLLLITWLVPERSRLDRLAVAPLVSIALGFAPAAWLSALGVPQAWHAAWVVPTLSAIVLAIVLGRRGQLAELVTPSRSAATVGLAVLASAATWCAGFAISDPGWTAVVPDMDGNSHGVFVARILASGSVSPSQVAVFDLADPSAQSAFYPLAIHSLAAPVAAATSVASALLLPLTLLASAVLVVGTASLARRVGGRRLVAPAAVIAAVLIPWFPFAQVFWGPVPLMFGVAALPGLVVALLEVQTRRGVVVAALGFAAMLGVHTTEAVVAVVVVLLVLVRNGLPDRRSSSWGLVGTFALASALAGPVVIGLLSGGATRPQETSHGGSVLAALVWTVLRPMTGLDAWDDPAAWMVAGSVLVACCATALAFAGAWRVQSSPLGAAVATTVALCLALGAAARLGVAPLLTVPWYGNADRIAAQAAGLLPVLVASGWLAVRSRVAATEHSWVLVAVGGATASVLLVQSLVSTSNGLSQFAVVTPDDRAAFSWLAARALPGERVLNEHIDGSVWMYEATGGTVAPVFGPKPSGGYDADPLFVPRLHLRDHVAEMGTDPVVREEARSLSVRYVLVGSRTFSDSPRLLDVEGIAASPAFREVFRSGDARVYEIVGD